MRDENLSDRVRGWRGIHVYVVAGSSREHTNLGGVPRYAETTSPRARPFNLSAGATLVGKRCELHSVPEVGQSFDEAVLLPFLVAGIEVVGAEVLVHRSVLEHVIDGREDRGGDGHDRLLGAAPRFDAVELGVEIGIFL